MTQNTPLVLCILDGFSFGDVNSEHNAYALARKPNIENLLNYYPYSYLKTSGESVGLPKGQMGNSEVGHTIIGSGRVVYQDLPKINNAIKSGELESHRVIQDSIMHQHPGEALHLMGLFSTGGVHSHIDHIIALAQIYASKGVKVFVHAISDGRDTPPQTILSDVEYFWKKVGDNRNIKLATICGRYYAMDRDNKWDRVERAYSLYSAGNKNNAVDLKQHIEKCYSENVFDEFIPPATIDPEFTGIKNEDTLLFANFRADRARQITEVFLGLEESVKKKSLPHEIIIMTEYSDKIINHTKVKVLFTKEKIANSLGEVLSKNGLKQLRIAETEKYAHVTFFLSGGQEETLPGEDRIMVPSPKVATYDLQPEMSLWNLWERLEEALNQKKYGVIIMNIANGDMVGHTGSIDAAKSACEHIDKFVGRLSEKVLELGGNLLISADHGNLEEMFDKESKQIHTQHTLGDVPFILIGKEFKRAEPLYDIYDESTKAHAETYHVKLKDGGLADIAPTILSLLKISKPIEMEGENLIIDKLSENE